MTPAAERPSKHPAGSKVRWPHRGVSAKQGRMAVQMKSKAEQEGQAEEQGQGQGQEEGDAGQARPTSSTSTNAACRAPRRTAGSSRGTTRSTSGPRDDVPRGLLRHGDLACRWVELKKHHRAIGVDIHGPTLDWGRARHVDSMTPDEQSRISLIEDDVRNVTSPKADVLCALNFSYCVFKTRAELRSYFQSPTTRSRRTDCSSRTRGAAARPRSSRSRARDRRRLHLRLGPARVRPRVLPDDLQDPFRVRGRQPTLTTRSSTNGVCGLCPRSGELLEEVGFQDVHVLWGRAPTASPARATASSVESEKGDADDAWIAYVVGRR